MILRRHYAISQEIKELTKTKEIEEVSNFRVRNFSDGKGSVQHRLSFTKIN